MGFWTGAFGVGASAFKGVGKMAVGGTAGRMVLGAGAGAAYGAITNPYENPNMGLGHIARSAAMGAGIGGLSRLVSPAVRFKTIAGAGSDVAGAIGPRNKFGEFATDQIGPRLKSGAFLSQTRTNITTSGMPAAFRAIPSVARAGYRAGSVGATTAGLAMRYPSATLALGTGALVASTIQYGAQSSPIMNNSVSESVSNLNLRTEDAMLSQMNNTVTGNNLTSGASIRTKQLMQSAQGLTFGLHAGRHS
jgi:hypothetical protein